MRKIHNGMVMGCFCVSPFIVLFGRRASPACKIPALVTTLEINVGMLPLCIYDKLTVFVLEVPLIADTTTIQRFTFIQPFTYFQLE